MTDESTGASPWISTQGQGAIAMHEMYRTYVAGGFTRSQALKIAIAILLDGVRYQRDNGD